MTEFVNAITALISGVFGALLNALSGIGNVIFTISESGTITSLTGFGWLLVIGIGIPLATWLFGKVFTWVKGLGKSGK